MPAITPELLRDMAEKAPDFDQVIERVERYMIQRAGTNRKSAEWRANMPGDEWCHHKATVEAVGKKYEKAGFIVSYFEDGLEISWRHSS